MQPDGWKNIPSDPIHLCFFPPASPSTFLSRGNFPCLLQQVIWLFCRLLNKVLQCCYASRVQVQKLECCLSKPLTFTLMWLSSGLLQAATCRGKGGPGGLSTHCSPPQPLCTAVWTLPRGTEERNGEGQSALSGLLCSPGLVRVGLALVGRHLPGVFREVLPSPLSGSCRGSGWPSVCWGILPSPQTCSTQLLLYQ